MKNQDLWQALDAAAAIHKMHWRWVKGHAGHRENKMADQLANQAITVVVMSRQIILDTETTGLEPQQNNRIIEIGCVELMNRKLTGRHFHHYINPQRDIDEGAQAVHGISAEFLADKPLFAPVGGGVLSLLRARN